MLKKSHNFYRLLRNVYRNTRVVLDKSGLFSVTPDIVDTFSSASDKGCDHYKCVFVHIPKTGGMSICRDLGVRNNHMTALQWKDINEQLFDAYFKFTFVRDPLQRFISSYRYLCYSIPSEDKDIELGQYILNTYKDISNFSINGIRDLIQENMFRPQTDFIYDKSDNLMVDYVGKMESYEKDRNVIYQKIKLVARENTVRNISSGPKPVLSDDAITALKKIYAKDFCLLDY